MKHRNVLSFILACIGGLFTIASRLTDIIMLHRLGFVFLMVGLILIPVNEKNRQEGVRKKSKNKGESDSSIERNTKLGQETNLSDD